MKRLLLLGTIACANALAQDGAALYKQHCAGCHDAPTGRVPPLSALRAMEAPSIVRALEDGVMKTQAAGLTSAERYAVITYLASPVQKTATPPDATLCKADSTPLKGFWNAWGVNSSNTRFQDAALAGLKAADVPKLKLQWAFGLGDGTAVRSQPAVSGGRLFTADLTGLVYALDARTGCVLWTFTTDAPVRTAIVAGDENIYFGNVKGDTYAVSAALGKLVWKAHVEDHFAAILTGAPQLHKGVLYVPVASYEEALPGSPTYECCTFRGSVCALDAATGKLIWKTYTIDRKAQPVRKSKTGTQMYGPSGVGVWSTPTFDEKTGALYVGTGDNYSEPATQTSDAVIAFDSGSGKILWSKQVTAGDIFNNGCSTPARTNCPDASGKDSDFGQPPMLVTLPNGRRALVIGQKSAVVTALDPDRQGEIIWQATVGRGGALGGIQWGSATDGENAYVALSDLELTVAADSSSPQGFSLGVDPTKGGGLFALKLATGEKVWSAKPVGCGERKHCSPAQSAAVTAIPGVVFSGSVDGHLRAYSASTGEVIWDVDTAREYETVNGKKAQGGSLDAGGPVIAGGMVFVNSGYGQWGGMPGNVLLAFSVR